MDNQHKEHPMMLSDKSIAWARAHRSEHMDDEYGAVEGAVNVPADAVVRMAESVAGQPVALELLIRRVLWNLRGADAGDAEAAMERAERQLAALICHDGKEQQ
jgi:hypothetical protein